MVLSQWIPWLLAGGAVVTVVSTYLYLMTAIAYRQRDNGLAYIVLIMGVGIWNGMFAAQLLNSRPIVEGFFLALSMVGALLAGLGWFLFASTASSTPRMPRQRLVYGTVGFLVGLDITLTITTPTHSLYWVLPESTASALTFAVIAPNVGYWLHTQLLVALFGAGSVLFAVAWLDGVDVQYTRAYAVAGVTTAIVVVGSNALFPGGTSVAPLVAVSLTTIGWVQAQQKRSFGSLQPSYWLGKFVS